MNSASVDEWLTAVCLRQVADNVTNMLGPTMARYPPEVDLLSVLSSAWLASAKPARKQESIESPTVALNTLFLDPFMYPTNRYKRRSQAIVHLVTHRARWQTACKKNKSAHTRHPQNVHDYFSCGCSNNSVIHQIRMCQVIIRKARGIASLNIFVVFMTQLAVFLDCLLYTSPSPRDQRGSRMPSSA